MLIDELVKRHYIQAATTRKTVKNNKRRMRTWIRSSGNQTASTHASSSARTLFILKYLFILDEAKTGSVHIMFRFLKKLSKRKSFILRCFILFGKLWFASRKCLSLRSDACTCKTWYFACGTNLLLSRISSSHLGFIYGYLCLLP